MKNIRADGVRRIPVAILLISLLSLAACNSMPEPRTSFQPGKGLFEFSEWAGPALPVWTYVPPQADSNTPIVFIMHGHKREPRRYRDDWVKFARTNGLLLVAPEFSNAGFPGARNYNLGGVVNKNGQANPKALWAYSAIEPIFDAVKIMTGNQQHRYAMYGHSAGGQFVHRFLYFVPEARVSLAIAANAGWYTMPGFDLAYPYGLGKTPATKANLNDALGQKLVILLGTEDTDSNHESLRRTPEANAQGTHRFARGHSYFETGKAKAAELHSDFCWRIEYASGVGHDNRRMAAFASQIFAADIPQPPDERIARNPRESGCRNTGQ